jgi:hypothetical protein
MGKEGQMIAVPLQAANPQMQDGNVVISLDQQMLQNAPTFSIDNWAQLEQEREQINAYFGGAGGMQRGMQGEQTQQGQQPMQGGQAEY